ncbi:hypothetical protein [Roseateles amylovorans]|jgi:hypothetical protein|uniref:Toxin co-regulated pilus biosynthesis protein Q C-terminal domain-containing protein n=1 Tax=Roseateles amylovorans TaxID=2978473 RepID=A0ABY6B4L7_9BURK|nr:hypothetical protein [Roseateles amylovorans]UXH80139.1 hypothetical protein N4261_09765 [Roseateles amylovorans]
MSAAACPFPAPRRMVSSLMMLLGAASPLAEAAGSSPMPESLQHPWRADYRLLPEANLASERLLLPAALRRSPTVHRMAPWLANSHWALVPVEDSRWTRRAPQDAFSALLRGSAAEPASPVSDLLVAARLRHGHSMLTVSPNLNGVRLRFTHRY